MSACAPRRRGTASLVEVFSAEYWRDICPHLHVGDEAAQMSLLASASDGACCSTSKTQAVRSRLIAEGYAHLLPNDVRWSTPVDGLAEGARCLARHGWPATALSVYDEAWSLGRDAAELMKQATGNTPVMDTLGFYVEPGDASKGFSPHRDRQPEDWIARGLAEDPRSTFRADGTAKYTTAWIALTSATTDNSCLHFIPAPHDPGYYAGDGDGDGDGDDDPMRLCFPNKEAYQNIRAVNLPPGGVSFHTHRAIHWGSAGRVGENVEPRISISFSFSDPEFEPPYFDPAELPFPPLRSRVALMSGQIINYSSLGGTDGGGWKAIAGPLASSGDERTSDSWAERLRLLHAAFRQESARFDRSYCNEITAKYVAATAEAIGAAESSASITTISMSNGSGGRSNKSSGCTEQKGCSSEDSDIEQGGHECGCADENDGEEGEEEGGFFGLSSLKNADDDVLDEALEALLDAETTESRRGSSRFTDDYDVLSNENEHAVTQNKRRRNR